VGTGGGGEGLSAAGEAAVRREERKGAPSRRAKGLLVATDIVQRESAERPRGGVCSRGPTVQFLGG